MAFKYDRKAYIRHLNDNYVHANYSMSKLYDYSDELIGEGRFDDFNDIFARRKESLQNDESIKDEDNIYNELKSFKEASILQSYQGNLFLESSANVLNKIEKYQPKSILELGCYTGILSDFIASTDNSINVTGIDRQKNLINYANSQFNRNNLSFHNLSYENISNTSLETYDLIFTVLGFEGDSKLQGQFNDYKFENSNFFKTFYEYYEKLIVCLDTASNTGTKLVLNIRILNLSEIICLIYACHKNKWVFSYDDFNTYEYDDYTQYGDKEKSSFPSLVFIKKDEIDLLDLYVLVEQLSSHKNYLLDPLADLYKYRLFLDQGDCQGITTTQTYADGDLHVHAGCTKSKQYFVCTWHEKDINTIDFQLMDSAQACKNYIKNELDLELVIPEDNSIF
jgi:SAM-dependent methyltransferase